MGSNPAISAKKPVNARACWIFHVWNSDLLLPENENVVNVIPPVFMGLLFLFSGYFTPGSLQRKGPGTFLKDRLMRLGIPPLFYVLLLSPIASWGYQRLHSPAGSAASGRFNLGVMWFVVMLFVLDLGYLAWRMTMKKNRSARPRLRFPGLRSLKLPSSRWRWRLSAICSGSLFRMARLCSSSRRLPICRNTWASF
ncbi:acyltransferase family protein [Papillibacter cinnamivorans]|uniref:acyltransferase family protein n=1 Tax=Papillibacter cinnamivorans TaxID=100176 RepID=UPI000A01BCE3